MAYKKRHIHHKIKGLKKQKQLWQKAWFWWCLLGFVVVGAVFYVLFFLPYAQVNNISVSGNLKVASQDIQDVAWTSVNKNFLMIRSSGIFLANTRKIVSNILHAFAVIENVSVDKNIFSRSLKIIVQERLPYAIFCSRSKDCFLIDSTGIAFEPLPPLVPDMLVLESAAGGDNVLAGERVVDRNVVLGIASIQKNLQDKFQVDVRRALVASPLVITTSEGWQVYFDFAQDLGAQITKLDVLLDSQISTQARKKLQYIYLQYDDRAYYK